MPARTTRRTTRKPRKTYRRKATRTRVPRSVPVNQLSTTRLFEATSVNATNAGNYGAAYSFNISSLPDVTDFTTLFDQYKLNKVEFTLIPNITSNDMNPVSTYYEMPNVHTVIDRDDDSAITSLTSLMQYPSYRRTRGHQVHKRTFVPALAQTIFKTASTTGTAQKAPMWLDLTDTTVPHFGLKLFIDQTNASTNIKYRLYIKYWLQFKGVR